MALFIDSFCSVFLIPTNHGYLTTAALHNINNHNPTIILVTIYSAQLISLLTNYSIGYFIQLLQGKYIPKIIAQPTKKIKQLRIIATISAIISSIINHIYTSIAITLMGLTKQRIIITILINIIVITVHIIKTILIL